MPKYQRSWRQQAATIVVVLLVVLWKVYFEEGPPVGTKSDCARLPGTGTSAPSRPGGLTPGEYRVVRVVDGDTLILDGPRGPVKVRLQGVNTPETVKEDTPVEKWGPEATQFTKAFVRAAGNRLRVEVDGEPRDQYDRFLAFLWDGDRMLNEQLVRAGLARAKLAYDYSQAKKDLLRNAQREAQRSGRGLWSDGN